MKTILILEDGPGMASTLAAILGRYGYRTLVVRTVDDALIALAACQPDLVLLDWIMPGMNGSLLLEMVEGHPHWKNVPFVVVSANEDAAAARPAQRHDAYPCLMKSDFSVRELVGQVQQQLSGSLRAA